MIYSLTNILVATAAAFLASSCKEKEPNRPSAQKPNEQQRVTPGDGGDGSQDDGSESDSDDSDDSGINTTLTAELIEECGVTDIVNAEPDQVINSKNLQSLPAIQNLLGMKVRVSTTLAINVTPSRTTENARLSIESIDGAFANLAQNAAQQAASEQSGEVTFENVQANEIAEIGDKFPQWKGVVCTFTAASRLTHNRGGQSITVSFDPPIPISLSPRAIARRYQTEIGPQRSFQNMTATIEASTNPNVPVGTKVNGSVTISAIETGVSIKQVTGQFARVQSDLAYRMNYNFGSPRDTFLLGLSPEVLYYLNHSKRDFLARVIHTKQANTPPMVYLNP